MESISSNELNEHAEVLSTLREVLDTKRKQLGVLAWHQKIVDFVDKLKKDGVSIDELKDCKIYHLLISSGSSTAQKLDLDGGVIQKFIENEL